MTNNNFIFVFLVIKEPRKTLPNTPMLDCPKCGRKYKTRESLSRHVRQECGVEPVFKCPHCEYRTKFRSNLQRHMQRINSCHQDAVVQE